MIITFLFLGKTQENLRNRVNIEVVTDEAIALKRVAKPSFKRSMIIRSGADPITCTEREAE